MKIFFLDFERFCLISEGGGCDGIMNKRFGTGNTVSMSNDSSWYLSNTIKGSFSILTFSPLFLKLLFLIVVFSPSSSTVL